MLAWLLIACLAWWPCGSRSLGAEYPTHRIAVIDAAGGSDWYHRNLREAMNEWNACGPIHLYLSNEPAFTPAAITIISDPAGPVGGWSGTYGVVELNAPWTRATPVIAHEMGHALGFNHTKRTDSVMGGANRVMPTDCEGLRRSYR